jgi:hypothetical protein
MIRIKIFNLVDIMIFDDLNFEFYSKESGQVMTRKKSILSCETFLKSKSHLC